MEDRSKELEKQESEKSNVFKSSTKLANNQNISKADMSNRNIKTPEQSGRTQKSINDLLTSQEDLAIDENYELEQYTLQKISLDWLNWTANFFDYANEPYLFYLTEILEKDFVLENGNLLYNTSKKDENRTKLMNLSTNFDENTKEIKKESELASLAFGTFNFSHEVANFKSFLETQKFYETLLHSKDYQKLKNSSEMSKFMGVFKALINSSILSSRLNRQSWTQQIFEYWTSWNNLLERPLKLVNNLENTSKNFQSIVFFEQLNQLENIYSPFRFLANFTSNDYNFNKLKNIILSAKLLGNGTNNSQSGLDISTNYPIDFVNKSASLISETTKKKFIKQLKQFDQNQNKKKLNSKEILKEITQRQYDLKKQTHKNLWESSKKALGQRTLKNKYRQDRLDLAPKLENSNISSNEVAKIKNSLIKEKDTVILDKFKIKNAKNYLNLNYFSSIENSSQKNSTKKITDKIPQNMLGTQYRKQSEQTFSYRKQAERALQEEELKKVFVIINSFGGSVGNGITVHDALQFIKAGSLTLALGVAASAASLALAGGTIGERYITEGCHTMIHQPEGSINGQASDILIDSNEIMKIRLDVAEIYSLSTYRPRHKILKDLDRDFYLTATETVYYGLADEIATNEMMQEIIEMTNKVWDYHESQQQRLLESRESATFGIDTQTQN